MKNVIQYISIFTLVWALAGCSDDDEIKTDPTAGLVKIQEGYALGAAARVEMWADEELFAGYNNLYVSLFDSVSGDRIKEAEVQFVPTMTMEGGMKHGCPVRNPEGNQAVNELFSGSALFIMPTSGMGAWHMQVTIRNGRNEKTGTAAFSMEVLNPATACMRSFVGGTGKKVFVFYTFPAKPKVGVNDIDLAIYEMVSGFRFDPITDYQVSLEPEMPSMDHGSPNNVNPAYGADGLYHGKVNFTMTGGWRLNFGLSRPGETSQEMFFDVTLD